MKLNTVLLSDVTFASYLLALSPEQKCETLIRTAFSSIYEQSREQRELLFNKEMIVFSGWNS
jgi:hypothetical protein